MSRLLFTSDLHLGHKNIVKFRPGFSSAEEHHEILFDNLATSVNKRDSIVFLGDIAFTDEWLLRIQSIKCARKLLVLGNHDTERTSFKNIVLAYDRIESLYSKRNMWFSHCPIHPDEFRGKTHNIHGHLHDKIVLMDKFSEYSYQFEKVVPDERYINVCVEHTDYKPIQFSDIVTI
jgi:calcineurin-like phosphoesterase family protein